MKGDVNTGRHDILVVTITDKIDLINRIYLPFFFEYVFRTNKGLLLGVAQKFVSRFLSSACLCLLNSK